MRVMAALCVLGLGVLAGCTPSTVVPATGVLADVKTIVVVPSLPRNLIVATRGVTVFGNHLDTPPIADWQLDQLVYQAAADVLGTRYSISEVVPKEVLEDYQSRLTAALDSDDGVAQLVKSEAAVTPTPDIYIVFCVSARSHPYVDAPGTPYLMQDIGVSKVLAPWGLPSLPPLVHSFLEMTVIDGHSMKVVYDSPLLMPPGSNVITGALMSRNDPYPEAPLKKFGWHNQWANMTLSEQREIEAQIKKMLQLSVTYTLQKSVMAH